MQKIANKNRRGVLASLVRIFGVIVGISAIRFAPLWADTNKDSAQRFKLDSQDLRKDSKQNLRKSNAILRKDSAQDSPKSPHKGTKMTNKFYTPNTKISQIISDFGDFGRLIFPTNRAYFSGETLGELKLSWYEHISPAKSAEIVNFMKNRVENGEKIFYDIYTPKEKADEPSKANTGLFFFKGKENAKFTICNAGGGFAYVGAMHDSFPHALELSKMGHNAFALIYRPNAKLACEDLARAISFVFANAKDLGVNVSDYSLWGGSAGARMAALLGSYGTGAFGERALPRPRAVIMQYTGHTDYTANEPPTYACVGENDWIANWRTMQKRLENISAFGVPTEFHKYAGLGHGFGFGIGTIAEGWINDAVAFWERQIL